MDPRREEDVDEQRDGECAERKTRDGGRPAEYELRILRTTGYSEDAPTPAVRVGAGEGGGEVVGRAQVVR